MEPRKEILWRSITKDAKQLMGAKKSFCAKTSIPAPTPPKKYCIMLIDLRQFESTTHNHVTPPPMCYRYSKASGMTLYKSVQFIWPLRWVWGRGGRWKCGVLAIRIWTFQQKVAQQCSACMTEGGEDQKLYRQVHNTHFKKGFPSIKTWAADEISEIRYSGCLSE